MSHVADITYRVYVTNKMFVAQGNQFMHVTFNGLESTQTIKEVKHFFDANSNAHPGQVVDFG